MLFCMAEYCDTLQSKEERNREYKLCLSRGTILHLLDGIFSLFITTRGKVIELSQAGLRFFLGGAFATKTQRHEKNGRLTVGIDGG